MLLLGFIRKDLEKKTCYSKTMEVEPEMDKNIGDNLVAVNVEVIPSNKTNDEIMQLRQ